MTFSVPDSAVLKPTPRASSVLRRPWTSMRPLDGGRIPEIARMRVDLPAPLWPTMPSTVPWVISKETSCSARTSLTTRSPLPSRLSADLKVGTFSYDVR